MAPDRVDDSTRVQGDGVVLTALDLDYLALLVIVQVCALHRGRKTLHQRREIDRLPRGDAELAVIIKKDYYKVNKINR